MEILWKKSKNQQLLWIQSGDSQTETVNNQKYGSLDLGKSRDFCFVTSLCFSLSPQTLKRWSNFTVMCLFNWMCHPPTISNSKIHVDHFESFPCVGSILDPHPKRQSWANKRQKAWEVNLSPKNGTCSHPYRGEQSQSHPADAGRTWMHWSKRCAKKCRTAARARCVLFFETSWKFAVAKLLWKLLSYLLEKALHLFWEHWELLTGRFLNFRYLVREVKDFFLESRGNIEGKRRGPWKFIHTLHFHICCQFAVYWVWLFLEVRIPGVFPLTYEVFMVSYTTVMKHWSLTLWSSQNLVPHCWRRKPWVNSSEKSEKTF